MIRVDEKFDIRIGGRTVEWLESENTNSVVVSQSELHEAAN